MVWSGDVVSPGGTYTGCSLALTLAHSGTNIVRATATSPSGLSGLSERLVIEGLAAELGVAIVSPAATGASGQAGTPLREVAHLQAAIVNPQGGSVTVTWFYKDVDSIHLIGSGETLDWLPTDTLGVGQTCGGILGELVVIVSSGPGSASATLELTLTDSAC